MIVISELLPKIQNLQASFSGSNANSAIIDLLRSANIEQSLPELPPLSPRRFMVRKLFPLLFLRLTAFIVVGCIHRVADIPHLG